jgi:hypothetical protein
VTDRIERELDLPASPPRVWRSLTDPDQVAQWLAEEVTLELWPGGEATFKIAGVVHLGWVEEVQAPGQDPDGWVEEVQAPGQDPDGWVEEVQAPPRIPHDPGDPAQEAARLTFWWAPEGRPASRVELVLYPGADGGTRLRIAETRPLEMLDLVGIPLPGHGGARFGPALVAA